MNDDRSSDYGSRIIRASEIGQYAYCAHAWWLGCVEGLPSAHRREMTAGEATHLQHGKGVRTSLALARLAYGVLLLAVVIGVVWVVSWLSG